MNERTKEGISLAAAAGGVSNTWPATQNSTMRCLAASVLSGVSAYPRTALNMSPSHGKKHNNHNQDRSEVRQESEKMRCDGGRRCYTQ